MATKTATELQTFEPGILDAISYVSAPSRRTHEPPAEAALNAFPANNTTTTVLSRRRAVIVITQLLGVQLFTSFCNGIIVVGLPAIASALDLEESLLLWPTSVFYLTAGSCLLMAGSIADVVGPRRVNLTGCFLFGACALACGLARTGGKFIAFRGLQGVTSAMVVPSSISIISTTVEAGRPRNMGFACLGLAGPLGFSFGLVLSGVFVDSIGWRPAFYLAGAAVFVLCGIGIWALPRDARPRPGQPIGKRLALEIDWVGTMLASTGMATLSYVLATLSSDINNVRRASNIALLILSAASVPAFIGWMNYQEKRNRPALISNPLWRNSSFTSICIMILFTSAVSNCMELFSSLFFQEVQGNSALGASLRILPSLIVGALLNLSTGVFVNRMPVLWVVLISSGLCAIAPLLMAIIRPQWLYWYDAFIAQLLSPLSVDILFTVGLLVITAVFPPHTQALGGAVFNTCSQLGTSIGLTTTSVIAASMTAASRDVDKASPNALMVGYRAVFWTMFAWMVFVCLVGGLGLRRVGEIGVKRD